MSASTQNQALNAIVFLYKEILVYEIDALKFTRAKVPQNIPVILSKNEVNRLLKNITGIHWLIASLLNGSGLRLMEVLRLRVKDIDFPYSQLMIRRGKGQKDRRTLLPGKLVEPLENQLEKRKFFT